jgi:topoisomerase-4 subunit B
MANYSAEDIEVLTGLDPVKKRPGMYTETTRPNHLAQEIIDNSVDEALAGHAKTIDVILHKDHSVTVTDDGRGMPVDIHPEQGKPGVEVILCTLHAGGKFSNKNYQFSGGLHGVGVSVVNALSQQLEVTIKRDGNVYRMGFANGDKATDLEIIDTCPKRQTGTSVRFLPNPIYFDTPKFLATRMRHVLRAKAVLCPGLTVSFLDETTGEKDVWYYEDGLRDYLSGATQEWVCLPEHPFVGDF